METKDLKYLDYELYQVEQNEDGSKNIHVDGYIFEGDGGLQLVQFTGMICNINENDSYKYDDFMDAADCCNQYQGPISYKDAVQYYSEAKPLPFCCVDENTPCGWYVNKL